MNMNDGSLARLLEALDAELASRNRPDIAAQAVLDCVEARVPGAVLQSAAGLQLRSLGVSAPCAS